MPQQEEIDILVRRGYQRGDKRTGLNWKFLSDGRAILTFVRYRRDLQSRYKFAALQGEAGRALMTRVGKDPDDLSTLVLVEWQEQHTAHQGNTDFGQSNEAPQEMVFIKSEAALRVVEDVGGYVLGTVAYVLRKVIPRLLRDFVYSYCVAPNRYLLFGKSDKCRRITVALKQRFLDLDLKT